MGEFNNLNIKILGNNFHCHGTCDGTLHVVQCQNCSCEAMRTFLIGC